MTARDATPLSDEKLISVMHLTSLIAIAEAHEDQEIAPRILDVGWSLSAHSDNQD